MKIIASVTFYVFIQLSFVVKIDFMMMRIRKEDERK